MRKGTVTYVDKKGQFGFVQDNGEDIFFHIKQGPGGDRIPKEGDRLVVFSTRQKPKGPEATEWDFEDEQGTFPVLRVWSGEPLSNGGVLANLQKFGLEDLAVTVVVKARSTKTRKDLNVSISGNLSVLSGDVLSGLDRTRNYCKIDPKVSVLQGDVEIGYLDDDGRFHYTHAPDLRTALGWVIATGVGRMKVVHGFGLEQVVKGIMTVVAKRPNVGLSAFYEKTFEPHIARVFPRIGVVRQHFGVEPLLWEVAMRTMPPEVCAA